MFFYRDLTEEWFCDSAATMGYHVHSQPEIRARNVLKNHGITTPHRARVLVEEDFDRFDYIFGMDDENIRDIESERPKRDCRAKVELLGSYDPEGKITIEDPYYKKGEAAFEVNYQQCLRSCTAFLDKNQPK